VELELLFLLLALPLLEVPAFVSIAVLATLLVALQM
jgi:hypothetical protein